VVETEGVGDDGCGCLEDELPQRGDAGGSHRQAEVVELGQHAAVGDRLPRVARWEQPRVGGFARGELVQGARRRVRARGWAGH